jgi:integrase
VPTKIRSFSLESATARLRLPVDRNPVWVKVGPGLGLGYRRNATAGTWVARTSDGKSRYHVKAIGAADDYDEADGTNIFSYWQAQDRARRLAGGIIAAVKPATVGDALSTYIDDLQTRGGDPGNATRLRGHLPKALRERQVALLSSAELRRWRDQLAETAAPATVNRIASVLKAVLNLAADRDERIVTRRAWEVGLAGLPNAEQSRNVILSEDELRRVLAAAREQSFEFGLLVEVLATSGARISQVAKMQVSDLLGEGSVASLFVPVSKKGKGAKAVRGVEVPISAALAGALRVASQDRPMSAPLLVKPSGSAWQKSDHARLFARAARKAGLADDVSIYSLRHTSITRQLLAGIPVRLVAAVHDTSVQMIERTYSRHIARHGLDLVRANLLDLSKDRGADVIPLRR